MAGRSQIKWVQSLTLNPKPWTLNLSFIDSQTHFGPRNPGTARWWHCRTSPICFHPCIPDRYGTRTGTASKSGIPGRSSGIKSGLVCGVFVWIVVLGQCLSLLLFQDIADIGFNDYKALLYWCIKYNSDLEDVDLFFLEEWILSLIKNL